MASAIDTASPDQHSRRKAADRLGLHSQSRGGRPVLFSRLGRTIVLLNLLGLAILVGGALILNESQTGLIQGRLESLSLQGELIATVIDQTATTVAPAPTLNADTARRVLRSLFIPVTQRARLYDTRGRLLADSDRASGRVAVSRLTPAARQSQAIPRVRGGVFSTSPRAREARLDLAREVAGALSGTANSDVRVNEDGHRVVSVSIPIRREHAVLSVLTLESDDVDSIVAAQRMALAPFALIAVGVALLSSLLLIQRIAVPVLQLARAADQVRLSRARSISLPDLAERSDELGDLTRSLETMTSALSDRMVAIERFAADVSHELRNPMTSIRSALETLDLVKTDAQRQRLTAILHHDVNRLDRLISDISNASRLDAELARDAPSAMDLGRLLADICDFYAATTKPGTPRVTLVALKSSSPITVIGREGPLGQVFRNLVDNARSFSPPEGEVRVFVATARGEVTVRVEDDGPGIPPDNIETVFERFYTSRPKGTAFGGNSGLGLAIVRQIITTHGGRVWAENRQDGDQVLGASFQIALPLA